MSDYYKIDFTINPINDDAADLMSAFLADIGFESFETTGKGLAAYIQSGLFDSSSLEDVIKDFPMDVNIHWEKRLIEHKDWNEEWEKKYFKPLVLGEGRCVIHSSFHKDYPNAEIDVTVDPKMAFGTGHHHTTAMMVNFLLSMDVRGKKVVDMGTGTGILAIIAKKLGAGFTAGIEIDPCAYENALENISLNHTEVLILLGDVKELQGMSGVEIFMANINRNIILEDVGKYAAVMAPGGKMLLSGFYMSDVPTVEKALNSLGLTVEEVAESSEWAAIKASGK